jgi:predicted component of type VI protein secretion system
MYDCVKAMPTHEARQALDKKERRHLDHIRQQTEIQLAESIKQDIRQLLQLLQPAH